MKFQCDEKKNRANLRKHGFDLADAVPMFDGPMLAQPDTREEYGENRWFGIGRTNGRPLRSAGKRIYGLFLSERPLVMSANSSKKRSRTNWKKVDALPDSKIDFSDIPELSTEFFRHAIRWPGRKEQITLRLDPDVLGFFRGHGKGYQTAINAVLRQYMKAQEDSGARRSG